MTTLLIKPVFEKDGGLGYHMTATEKQKTKWIMEDPEARLEKVWRFGKSTHTYRVTRECNAVDKDVADFVLDHTYSQSEWGIHTRRVSNRTAFNVVAK